MGQAARAEPPRYVFGGREVTLPVVVRKASSASTTYVVPSREAQAIVGGSDLVVAEVTPGRTLFSIAAIDYQDNDLGDYNEVSLAFFVRPRGERALIPYVGNIAAFLRTKLGTYIHRLPVNQSFTRDAGCGIWGFPKTVEEITIDDRDGRSQCTLTSEGRHVLTFSVPRGGKQRLPDTEMVTYSRIDGVTHRTSFVSGAAGVGFHLGGAELALGDHPIAQELGRLGLPKRALLSVWMEAMHGRFEAPIPI
jgi:hypothetical protein